MTLTDDQKRALIEALENEFEKFPRDFTYDKWGPLEIWGLVRHSEICGSLYLTDSGRLLAEALREIERCKGVLRKVEWEAPEEFGIPRGICPVCGSWFESGHGDDCKLESLL